LREEWEQTRDSNGSRWQPKRKDLGQIIYFGIDSMDPAVKSQIVALRDSGKIVHLYGTLLSNVPDYNGSQIQVDRIEVEG
jgi:hypothetical protein